MSTVRLYAESCARWQEHMEAAKLELAAITARSMEDTGVCHAAGMDRQHSIPLTVDFNPESTSCESGALLEAQGELAGSSHALPVEASGTQEGEQQPAPCSPHPNHQQAAAQHPSHHSQGASYAPELLWWMLPPPPPPPPPPPAFLFFTPQPQGSWDQPAYS